jgi:hypothetical protein
VSGSKQGKKLTNRSNTLKTLNTNNKIIQIVKKNEL